MILTVVRLELDKALSPILTTLSGISIDSIEHPENAPLSMLVNPLGIITEARLL